MTVKISGTFKKDVREYQGLEAIAEDLKEYPFDRVYVVGCVETKKIMKNVDDGGTEDITVRFLHIEPVDGDTAQTVKTILNDAFKARVGRDELPQETLPADEE